MILITLVCLGFGIGGALKLEQRFKTEWFLPKGSHLAEFLRIKNVYYPEKGFDAGFYMGALNYSHELSNIGKAAGQLENMSDVTANVVSWVDPFRDFVLYNFKHGKSLIIIHFLLRKLYRVFTVYIQSVRKLAFSFLVILTNLISIMMLSKCTLKLIE